MLNIEIIIRVNLPGLGVKVDTLQPCNKPGQGFKS